jgi:hypothetical protein
MVLGLVVGLVFSGGFPHEKELGLSLSIEEPVVSHVEALGLFLFDGVVRKAHRCDVVKDDGCGWLWVSHFVEGGADGNSFFAVDKSCANFGVGGR